MSMFLHNFAIVVRPIWSFYLQNQNSSLRVLLPIVLMSLSILFVCGPCLSLIPSPLIVPGLNFKIWQLPLYPLCPSISICLTGTDLQRFATSDQRVSTKTGFSPPGWKLSSFSYQTSGPATQPVWSGTPSRRPIRSSSSRHWIQTLLSNRHCLY